MVPIISVVGKTNSGKTTLIEKIIPILNKRGYKVGTIKHDVHQFEIDHEGKDTWRMTQAGADTVIIASGEKMGVIKKINRENNIDEITQQFLQDVDIVITEGYKKQNKPKIEVTCSEELLCGKDDNLFAVVFNPVRDRIKGSINGINIPYFGIDEAEKITDLIEEKFLKNQPKKQG